MNIVHRPRRSRAARDLRSISQTPAPPGNRSARGGRAVAVVIAVLLVGTVVTAWLVREGARRVSISSVSSQHNRSVVWRPLRPATPSGRTPGTSDVSACVADGIEITATTGGGAGGTFYVPLSVKNITPAPCSLDETELSFSWPSGTATTGESSKARLISPSGTQDYDLGFAGPCVQIPNPGSIEYVPLSASLGGVPVTIGGSGIPDFVSNCATAVVSAKETVSPEDAGTGPYSALDVSIEAPQGALIAGTFRYSVILTNTGPSAFTFDECPTYVELIGIDDQLHSESYVLNCPGVSIDAGDSVTFDMQIDVPKDTNLAKLTWSMNDGPSAVGVVRG